MFHIKLQIFAVIAFLLTVSAIETHHHEIEPRILQGQDAVRGQFPFYVILKILKALELSVCGATLISDQWILTSAHCVNNVTYVEGSLGVLDAQDEEAAGRQHFLLMPSTPITDYVFIHPRYNKLTKLE